MDDIRKKFEDPPVSFGPTPFWSVNDTMAPDAILASLKDLKEKGMAGVIIHPRSGFMVDYLSPEFWTGMDFIVESLVKLDMHGWIYDEYNWPSGVVGGKLLREHPEYCQRGLGIKFVTDKSSIELPGPLIAAFDVGANGHAPLRGHGNQITFVLPGGVEKAVIFFEEPMTDSTFATTCAPWARQEPGMLDYLNPAAVKRFMEMTHFEYARRYSKHFGKTLLGVFTDEPQNHRGLIWCSDFPVEFKKRAGYDLLDFLYRLAIDVPGAEQTRLDYYRIASQLYRERYFDVVARWCDENGLIFTGHLSAEDYLSIMPANHASLFEPLSAMQMPGVDWLGLGYGMGGGPTLAETPNMNPKMLSSIAHVTGRERTLVELWGGGGWAATPAKLKFSLDWMLACGVNFINPHLAWVSAKGLRKRDFPQSFSSITPWWEMFLPFSKYIARMSWLLSRGTHRARALLLFPTVAMWAVHRARGDLSPQFKEIVKGVEETTESLLCRQHDFDYLFEEALPRYKITDGAIEVGSEKFDAVVVQPNLKLQPATAEWLKKAKDAGVKIVEGHASAQEIIAALERAAPASLAVEGKIARRIVAQHREIDGLDVFFLANLGRESGDVTIRLRGMAGKQVEKWNPVDGGISECENVNKDGNDLTIDHYFHTGASVVFVCGDGSRAQQAAPLHGSPEIIELDGGWDATLADKNIFLIEPWSVKTRFRPVRSFSELHRDKRYGLRARVLIGGGKAIVTALNPVMRREKYYRFERFFNFGGSNELRPLAEGALGVKFDKLGIYEAMEYLAGMLDYIPTRTIGGAPFPMPGEKYKMTAKVAIESVPEDLELVYEDLGEPVVITVNGRPVKNPVPMNVWDACNRAVSIAELVNPGKNEIVFESRMPNYPGQFPCFHAPEAIVLRGTFRVAKAGIKSGMPTATTGQSWTRQGLPHYIGEVIYRRNFEIKDTFSKATIDLGDVRDVAEVLINSVSTGIRMWPPYVFDIKDALNPGKNRIEARVRATAANLFWKPRNSGLLSTPRLILYKP